MKSTTCTEKIRPMSEDVERIKIEFEDLKKLKFRRLHHYPPLSLGSAYNSHPGINELWGGFSGKGTLYFHIPFCVSKCTYCPFFICAGSASQIVDEYLDILIKEGDLYKDVAKEARFSSLYFGGGTPTYMEEDHFTRIYNYIAKSFNIEEAEFTVEANPSTLTPEKLRHLKSLGVTRLSIGIQTFDEELLKIIGRYNTNGMIDQALDMIKEVGFEDINVDLMYGLPEQTLEKWQRDIERFTEWGIRSVTIYQTGYLPHVRMQFIKSGYRIPDEEDACRMYEFAFKYLNDNGYIQPNVGTTFFIRSGINKNRENILLGLPILGLGVSAYSTTGDHHYKNLSDMDGYRKRVFENHPPIEQIVRVPEEEKLRKYVIETLKLGFIDKKYFQDGFGKAIEEVFGNELKALEEMGLIEDGGREIRYTFEGLRYSKEMRYLFASEEARKRLVF